MSKGGDYSAGHSRPIETVMLPECLVLKSYKCINCVFRDVFVLNDSTTFSIIDTSNTLASIIIDDRICRYLIIDFCWINLRCKSYNCSRIDCKHKCHGYAHHNKIANSVFFAKNAGFILNFFTCYHNIFTSSRGVIRIRLSKYSFYKLNRVPKISL